MVVPSAACEEKTLHAYSGGYHPVPEYELESSARLFARSLGTVRSA
jgi:hypothetical protein